MLKGMRKVMFGYKIKGMHKGCVRECTRCLDIKHISYS